MTNDRMILIVPPFTIKWFGPGEHCTDAVDADLLLIDHGTWEDRAIEYAQDALLLTEPELKGYTWCAHNAIIRGKNAEDRTMVSGMGPGGYERRPLYDYKHHLYAVIHFEVNEDLRANAVQYDEACVNLDYGWSQYLFIGVDDLTGVKLACSCGGAIICSTHATLVEMGLGLFPDRPPSLVVPARMALWCDAKVPHGIVVGPPTSIIVTPGIPRNNVGPPTTIIVTPGIPREN